jgi:hypothetical protein
MKNEQDNSGCWTLVGIVLVVIVIIAIVRSCKEEEEPPPTPTPRPPATEVPEQPTPEPEYLGELFLDTDVVLHGANIDSLAQLYDSDLMYEDDTVRVQSGGAALLSLIDEIELLLFNETALTVLATGNTSREATVRLDQGGFLGRVSDADRGPVEFPLPGGGYINVWGTDFLYVYDSVKHQAWVANFNGGVEVTSGGMTITVAPGEIVHIEDRQPPDSPLPLNVNADTYGECETLMRSLQSPVAVARIASSTDRDIQFTLTWGSTNDLDLIVIDPEGYVVGYPVEEIAIEEALEEAEEAWEISGGYGYIDHDANAYCEETTTAPIENIYYPEDTAPSGTYTVQVQYFMPCDQGDFQNYTLTIQMGGMIVEVYEGTLKPGEQSESIYVDY